MKEAHTALPWKIGEDWVSYVGLDEFIKSRDDVVVVNIPEGFALGAAGALCVGPKAKANAAFIVKACNSHDALTNALKEAQGIIINMRTENRLHGHITDASAKYLHKVEPQIDAALALTETRETK